MSVHFVIRSIGHKKREFRPGDTLTIGRAPTNDMVFNDQTVSGEHAVVRWDPDQAFPVVEIKSSFGVEIDDRVHEDAVFLTDYTTLGIGDFAVIFQPKGRKKSRRAPRQKPPTTQGGLRLFSEDTTRVQGNFTTADSLHAVLSQLEADERTGTLVVTVGEDVTKVVFGQGVLISVERDGAGGIQAVGELFALEGGDYRFSAEITPSEENLQLSVKRLIAGMIR